VTIRFFITNTGQVSRVDEYITGARAEWYLGTGNIGVVELPLGLRMLYTISLPSDDHWVANPVALAVLKHLIGKTGLIYGPVLILPADEEGAILNSHHDLHHIAKIL
jgi:hypothetical protein